MAGASRRHEIVERDIAGFGAPGLELVEHRPERVAGTRFVFALRVCRGAEHGYQSRRVADNDYAGHVLVSLIAPGRVPLSSDGITPETTTGLTRRPGRRQ
jgi:hypothetical protein